MTIPKRTRRKSPPAAKGKSVAAGKKDHGTQLKRLRRLCLALPGTMEKISHGEPTFFTPKRVFAMFANNHHNDGHVAVWLPVGPGVQDALIEEEPQTFFRPPYVGPAGWIGVELSAIDDDRLGSLIREAFHMMAAKDREAGSRKSSGRRRTTKAL
jgi:hypothetical protein